MANVNKVVIEVYWRQLRAFTEESSYKRDCPFCKAGILLVGRDSETMVLEEYDRCITCGQRVRYLDIEVLRARER